MAKERTQGFAGDEIQGVLLNLDREIRDRPDDAFLHDRRAEICFRLGWYREAREAMQAALRIDPRIVDRHVRLVSLLLEGHDHRPAVIHLSAITRMNPEAVDSRFLLARLLCDLGRRRAAARQVEAGLRVDPTPVRYLAAADLLIEAGEFEQARRCLARAARHQATRVAARVRNARLSLWRGDVTRAARDARALIKQDRTCGDAHSLLGAALVLRGDLAQAVASLDEAVRLNPNDHDSLVWRSEARRRQGQLREAQEDAHRAISSAVGYSLAANIDRIYSVAGRAISEGWRSFREPSIVDVLDGAARLIPARRRARAATDPQQLCAALDLALTAFRGNRSMVLTTVSRRRLTRFHTVPDPRLAARFTQSLIRTRDLDDVLAEFRTLIERYPKSATVLCHRGELLLWAGRYDDANDDFQRALALDKSTRWAWIGSVAVALLRGDPDEAIALDEASLRHVAPPPGRTLFTYRGEAHRRKGDRKAARRDLEEATRLDPARPSAWINLALLSDEEGDPSLASAVLRRLEDHAPGLIVDATRELAIPLRPWPPSRAAIRSLLDRGLSMMRGNRSSFLITYFTGDRIRFARPFSTNQGSNGQ